MVLTSTSSVQVRTVCFRPAEFEEPAELILFLVRRSPQSDGGNPGHSRFGRSPYILVLMAVLFVLGIRIVAQDGIDSGKSAVVGISIWLGVGFWNQQIFPDYMGGTLATILGNGMAAGGLAAIVMTVALDLAKPRRRRVKAMLSVESLREIDGFICKFAADKGWNEASTERLRAAAEESVLSLIPDEEASEEEEARHRLLLIRGEARAAELEVIALAVDGNREGLFLLLGQ